MKLCVTDNKDILNPTSDDINYAINRMIDDETEFIVIENENNFIQAIPTQNGFLVEYKEGSDSKHFQSVESVTKEVLINMLEEYVKGYSNWRYNAEWKLFDRDSENKTVSVVKPVNTNKKKKEKFSNRPIFGLIYLVIIVSGIIFIPDDYFSFFYLILVIIALFEAINKVTKHNLEKILQCPNCKKVLELELKERRERKFICPECNKLTNLNKST